MHVMAENIKQLKENGLINSRVPLYDQYRSQWIERWTRADSTSVCQSHQQDVVSYASKEEIHAEETGHLEGKTQELTKIKILKIDTNEKNAHEFNNLMMQKKVNSEVFSPGARFLHKMPNSNVNVEILKNISEWNNLLMVDSNRKTYGFLNPLDTFGTGKSSKEGLSLWRNTLASQVVEFAEREQQFAVQTMAKCLNQDMQHYKPVKCSSCFQQYENQRQIERTSILINEEEKGCPLSSQLQGNNENRPYASSSRLHLNWEDSPSISRLSDLGQVYELFRKMPNSSVLDVDFSMVPNASSSIENKREEGVQKFPNADQSFFKTKKMCMDFSSLEHLTIDMTDSTRGKGISLFEIPTRSEGTSSNGLEKEILCSDVSKDQLPPSLLVEQVKSDIGISRRKYKSTNPETSAIQRARLSNSSAIVENLFQADSCSRWRKRFSPRPSDSPAIVSKKYKTADSPSSGKQCWLLRKEINYKIPSCLKGNQVLRENIKLTKSAGCSSGVPAERLSSWFQRWSHNDNRITRAQVRVAGPALCKPENSYMIDDNSEGELFPSVAAMALMGRLMKQFNSCVFHRRGSSVVWNIGDL